MNKKIITILWIAVAICMTTLAIAGTTINQKYDPNTDLVIIDNGKGSIGFNPISGDVGTMNQSIISQKDKNKTIFYDILGDGIDIEYQDFGYLLKEKILIEKQIIAAKALNLEFKITKNQHKYESDDMGISFYDENDSSLLFRILPPYMTDAHGKRTDLAYTYDGHILKLVLDDKVLSVANYPIEIDPTIQYGGFTTWDETYWNYSNYGGIADKGVTNGYVWTFAQNTSGRYSSNLSTKQLYLENVRTATFTGGIYTTFLPAASGNGYRCNLSIIAIGSGGQLVINKTTYIPLDADAGDTVIHNRTNIVITRTNTTFFNITSAQGLVSPGFDISALGTNVNILFQSDMAILNTGQNYVAQNFSSLTWETMQKDSSLDAIYNGLVAEWGFNSFNLTSNTTPNLAVYGNDANTVNITATNVVNLTGNASINLTEETGSYLTYPNKIISNLTEYSIETHIFFKHTDSAIGRNPVLSEGVNGNDLALYHYSNAWLSYEIYPSNDPMGSSGITAKGINRYEWYHVVVTVTPNTMKMYINGQLNVSNSQLTGYTGSAPTVFNIGRFFAAPTHYYGNSTINYIKIYNRSLTSNEVNILYDTLQMNHRLGQCYNLAMHFPILNFTYYDDITDNPINVTSNAFLYYGFNNVSLNITDAYSMSLCVNLPTNNTINLSGSVTTSKPSYLTRIHTISQGYPLSIFANSMLTYPLYLIGTDNSSTVLFSWFSTQYQPIDGVMEIYKCVEDGGKQLVESISVVDGLGVANIATLYQAYAYAIIVDGVRYTDDSFYTCHLEASSTRTFYVNLVPTNYSPVIGMFLVNCELTKVGEDIVNLRWGSNPSVVGQVEGCLVAYRSDIYNKTEIYRNCSNYSNYSMTRTIPNDGNTYYVNGEIHQGSHVGYCRSTITFTNTESGGKSFGLIVLFGILILIMSLILIYSYDSTSQLFAAVLGIVVSVMLGILLVSWTWVISIIAFLVIIAVIARVNK